jgi:hypothetical protein
MDEFQNTEPKLTKWQLYAMNDRCQLGEASDLRAMDQPGTILLHTFQGIYVRASEF